MMLEMIFEEEEEEKVCFLDAGDVLKRRRRFCSRCMTGENMT